MKSFEDWLARIGEIGYVSKVVNNLVDVQGLPGVKLGEMVWFESGQLGRVIQVTQEMVEVLMLSRQPVGVGVRVTRLDKGILIGVGQDMLGKTLDVLGRPLDPGQTVKPEEFRTTDVEPMGIASRKKISRKMHTGVILVDLMVPVGMGQRELIIGDRKTGKSQMIMQMILSQASYGTVCIYAAIGLKRAEIVKVREYLTQVGVMGNVIIVAANSQDASGAIFLCPYTAMTIAEYFRDHGRDVLLVLDDMSTHAKFYREISLLARKFPGRDSYPGDIFHIHSKLLERAGNYWVRDKEVAITCLPVVESIQGDLTGYIQTNLMSMTDGHIYFDADLFFKGRRPAINPFLSVTRVGRQTQEELERAAGRMLFDLLNTYEKTQGFLRFGTELGENSRQILAMGDRVLGFFDQPLYSIVPTRLQLVMLALLVLGVWQGKGADRFIRAYFDRQDYRELVDKMNEAKSLDKLYENIRKNSEGLMGVLQTGGSV